jgi:hypothetical protein
MGYTPRKKNELMDIDRLYESISTFSFNKNILNEAPQSVDTSKYKNINFKDRVVGSSTPSKDKINPSLLADVDKAAGIAGTKASITTAVTGHKRGTRHESGLAVDVAMFDGKGYSGVNSAKKLGIYDKIVKFVNALEDMGYKVNSERGNDKAVLWFGFPNHHHHVHISRKSDDGSSTYEKSDDESKDETQKPDQTTPKIKKIFYTAFSSGEQSIIKGVLEKLDSVGVKDNFSKIVLASLVIYKKDSIVKGETISNSEAETFIGDLKDKTFNTLDECLDFFEEELGKREFNKSEIKTIAEKFDVKVSDEGGGEIKLDLEKFKSFMTKFEKIFGGSEVKEIQEPKIDLKKEEEAIKLNEEITRIKNFIKKIL